MIRAILLCGLAAIALSSPPSMLFEDVTGASRVDFILRNTATKDKHQIETMAGGVAVFDFDNDGYPDIYFTNGAAQPSLQKVSADYSNRLYRNKGNWQFEDVTARAGVGGRGYDMGVAAADYDNDGYEDLFVTGVHGNTLFHNRGDGTFEDVTRKAGLTSDEWAVSAAWIDYDNDGLLDLIVVNYVKWDPAREPFCADSSGRNRTYCHPRFYDPLPNLLYHNNGDGTFTNVSTVSGIGAYKGKGMGVAIADYDHDGRMDIFVANDATRNYLFHNEGNGRFREAGLTAGVALTDDAVAISSMGVDFRDVNNDGREDLFVTALAGETFPLFVNLGRGIFSDMTYPSLTGAKTAPFSGWGAGIFDFDNDGWKDVFTANGDVQSEDQPASGRSVRQRCLVLLNDRSGRFRSELLGSPALHRGAAFGDFDRDGRLDVVVTALNERPVLLRNVMGTANHWIGLKLVGSRSNRDAIGARVQIRNVPMTQVNHVTTAVGYASSSEPTVHFGLGERDFVDEIDIEWPSGARQKMTSIKGDRYVTVREP